MAVVEDDSLGIRKAALPMLVEARPHSVKATGQLLEGSGPESVWPSVGAWQQWPMVGFTPSSAQGAEISYLRFQISNQWRSPYLKSQISNSGRTPKLQ